MFSTICPEDEACIMLGLADWVEKPSIALCMFHAMEAEAMELTDAFVAIFFRGGWDAERSLLDFRLFGLLVATLLLLLKRGPVDGERRPGNNLSRSYKHLPAAH
jgi:NADH:ubiquinone oxidoreductase subunit H